MSNTTLTFDPAVRDRVADVRALAMRSGDVCATGWQLAATDVRGTTVPVDSHIAVGVRTGAFPGSPAWSPPTRR